MRNDDTGAVLVVDNGSLKGIVTDRDIAVRGVADGQDPSTKVTEVYTADPATLTPDQSVEDAIRIVREKNVRRIPVVQDGRPASCRSATSRSSATRTRRSPTSAPPRRTTSRALVVPAPSLRRGRRRPPARRRGRGPGPPRARRS